MSIFCFKNQNSKYFQNAISSVALWHSDILGEAHATLTRWVVDKSKPLMHIWMAQPDKLDGTQNVYSHIRWSKYETGKSLQANWYPKSMTTFQVSSQVYIQPESHHKQNGITKAWANFASFFRHICRPFSPHSSTSNLRDTMAQTLLKNTTSDKTTALPLSLVSTSLHITTHLKTWSQLIENVHILRA